MLLGLRILVWLLLSRLHLEEMDMCTVTVLPPACTWKGHDSMEAIKGGVAAAAFPVPP